jgi:CysZ protein
MSSSPVPQLTGGVSDLFTGLGLPLRSLSLIFSTGPLFRLSLLASFVTALALVVIGPAAWVLTDRFAGHGVWGAIAHGALFILLYVIGALSIPPLLLAPLQDPISEATERRCGETPPKTPFVAGTLSSLGYTLKRIALMLAGLVVLLPLNLVPGAGSALYAVTSTAWGAWWLTAEYLSGPMARHLLPFRAVLAAMRTRKLACLGFGCALYVLLWLPIVNFFLVPIAVVGGTLLFRALKDRGNVWSPVP